MNLRNQLMALSLLTLLLPWSGWKLLQELESFLRESQEMALLSTAGALSSTLPFDSQRPLLYSPDDYVVMRRLDRLPVLDGFSDDWVDPDNGLTFSSINGELKVKWLVGSSTNDLFLFFQVENDGQTQNRRESENPDGVELWLRSPRGLLRFNIRPEAPGPVQLYSENGSRQAEAYWRDTADGFVVEIAIPALVRNVDLDFALNSGAEKIQSHIPGNARTNADIGRQWLTLVSERNDLSSFLTGSVPPSTQAWLVNQHGWVLASSGAQPELPQPQTTWVQRWLYRLVAGSRTRIEPVNLEPKARLHSDLVIQALDGAESRVWTQDVDTAVLLNSVAVPVILNDQVRGAIVVESASEGLLLVTNRALGRLLLTTLAITFGLAGGLWFFATRLSRRVRRLSNAVSEAMEESVVADQLPLVSDRDELGELARNNAKLLRAVAEHKQYLQTLAGKLSHELKTPLAITRSSLENLSSRSLDEEAQRFLKRAQEGVDRQAAIVRAMSDANRLETAIGSAEWAEVDLVDLINNCAQGYRSAHPERTIQTHSDRASLIQRCAPELIAQALDKLVDNAISLSEETDVVSLTLSQRDDELQITVSNTGSSLPDEFQERLFDSLVSIREKRGQTAHLGLGLYIVRLVAESHGGSVSAQNLENNQGVAFSIKFPGLEAGL